MGRSLHHTRNKIPTSTSGYVRERLTGAAVWLEYLSVPEVSGEIVGAIAQLKGHDFMHEVPILLDTAASAIIDSWKR